MYVNAGSELGKRLPGPRRPHIVNVRPLVCRGCPPPPPGSLRRPRQSARNALPRMASEVRTTNSSTTTNRVPPPTLIQSLLHFSTARQRMSPAAWWRKPTIARWNTSAVSGTGLIPSPRTLTPRSMRHSRCGTPMELSGRGALRNFSRPEKLPSTPRSRAGDISKTQL